MALKPGKHGVVVVHGTEDKLPKGEFLTKITNFMADALIESPVICDQCEKEGYINPVVEREADIEGKPARVTLRITPPYVHQWEKKRQYKTGDHVLPAAPNGFRYRCEEDGESGDTEPNWAVKKDNLVIDGDARWKEEIHRLDRPWDKKKQYKKGDIVGPPTPNGFRYKYLKSLDKSKPGTDEPDWGTTAASVDINKKRGWKMIPGSSDPVWEKKTTFKKGSYARPTVPNGFRYECILQTGTTDSNEPDWPCEPNKTVKDGTVTWQAEPEQAEWVFKEAHWVDAFSAPSAGNVIKWLFTNLPDRLAEFWLTLFVDAGNKNAASKKELREAVIIEESDYKASFWLTAVFKIELFLMAFLFFILSVLMTILLPVIWFLWWVPLGLILRKEVKGWWNSIPSILHAGDAFLTNMLGDTKRIVEHGVWAANIRGILEKIVIEMLNDKDIKDITVIAHSLGCGVVHDAFLEDSRIAREIEKLGKRKKITYVTCGSAVNAILKVAEGSNTYAKKHFLRPFDKNITGKGRADFYWLDIWARFDPIRFLRIGFDEVGKLGISREQWKSRCVVNLDNPMGDHSYYWLNKDQVVPRIVRAINNGDYPWVEAGITDAKLKRHDRKVATIGVLRLLTIATIIGSGIWLINSDGWDLVNMLMDTENQTAGAQAQEEMLTGGKWIPFVLSLGVYGLYELVRSLFFGDVSGGTAKPASE